MSFLDGKYTSGQYTYKIYKVETKLPKFLRTIFRTVMENTLADNIPTRYIKW